MFVKPTLRKSLLAKMLGELLDTRVMIKQAMKGYKSDKVCQLPMPTQDEMVPSLTRPLVHQRT